MAASRFRGDTMVNLVLDAKLLFLLSVANGVPVVAQKLLGGFCARPLDGGFAFLDGQPLLGASKTVRGILFSLLLTTAVGVAIDIKWQVAFSIAATAMVGDLASSFFKRRMRLPASGKALGLDQIPESLLPALVCVPALGLSAIDVAIIVLCFFIGELWLSRILYRLHLRNRPY